MKRLAFCALLAACGGATSNNGVNPARAEANERVSDATTIARELADSGDAAIPLAIARSARCVAIVPGLVHVGLLLGARAGRGVVTCLDGDGWTAPRFFVMNGATAGLAAGVERIDLVMLVMSRAGETDLLRGKLRIGTAASITGGVGRNAEVGSDVELAAPILYYSRSKGLFVGLDLSGTVLEQDEEATRAFYGDARDFGVLLRAPAGVPPLVPEFQNAVARTFARYR